MEEMRQFHEIYNIDIEQYEEIDIDNAEFSVRVRNRLHHAGIHTIGSLLKCNHSRLAVLNGFGLGCFKEIYEYLKKLQNDTGFANENIECNEKNTVPPIFIENAELVVAGDFSFVLNDEENKELVEKYRDSQWLIGSELAKECIENPIYMESLGRELYEFAESIACAKNAINNIPCIRRGKKVINYINSCSSISTGKAALQDKNQHSNETLAEYIKANAKELLNEHSPMSRFVKKCTYNLNGLINSFFEELRKNERTFEIIKQRAAGKTLEQVGIEYTVTRERVRQIEKKASEKFDNWVKHNSIILKIVADEDGNCVLLPSAFDVYLSEYADVFSYLLKINEEDFSNVFYDKDLNLFIIGEESLIMKAQEYVEELPEQFNDVKLEQLLEIGFLERELPQELVRRVVEQNYKKTGDIYHCTRLTLGKIYADVLEKYYQKGIWVYNNTELESFKKHVREDYGEIKLSDSNRALVGRIAAVGILCGRGIYGPKKEKYISDELSSRIYEYICESESSIFLTNTLYSVFEEELINEGVYNKYHLQGILKELFGDKFVFRRDYVSKDANLTSVYSEIVGFIQKAIYPVTKQQIVEAFPGVTEIIINLSISDPEIINLFGVYVHSNKIKLNVDERVYIKNSVDMLIDKNNFIHCKNIYEYIQRDNPTILSNNGIYQAFGLYSIIEYLYREDMEFLRPYIGKKGSKITRTFEQLHEMVHESETIQLSDILSVAKENHFQINSILDFANSCNDTHLLINDRELAELSYIGITEQDAKEIEQIIIEDVSDAKYISDLSCSHKFRRLNVPWTNWLIYSVLLKWASKLEVMVTSTTFRQAQPVVALKGNLNAIDVGKLGGNEVVASYMPDNLENIDDLISDIILEEIEVE